ncbi:uncharacterized protein BDZ83DRAFT_644539 [Colletotrichum acutatum]|uniref:Uncharacterized protein n=1 Tax=Glomerella acutata TaxID=27357 RepID=A0AAD8U7H8_GLOAC|nr:uncharacterized protein BDZ83DRAFT_644539 [Colletotrichum acutatum]KAK1704535.1 hypothetical protein BDZ83DRAFT_644539 [Colletotrichum acutatum]
MPQRRITTASLSTDTSLTLTAFGDVCARGPNRRAIGWFHVLCLQLRATIPSVGLTVGCLQIVVCVLVSLSLINGRLGCLNPSGFAACQRCPERWIAYPSVRSTAVVLAGWGLSNIWRWAKEAGRQSVCQSHPCRFSFLAAAPAQYAQVAHPRCPGPH